MEARAVAFVLFLATVAHTSRLAPQMDLDNDSEQSTEEQRPKSKQRRLKDEVQAASTNVERVFSIIQDEINALKQQLSQLRSESVSSGDFRDLVDRVNDLEEGASNIQTNVFDDDSLEEQTEMFVPTVPNKKSSRLPTVPKVQKKKSSRSPIVQKVPKKKSSRLPIVPKVPKKKTHDSIEALSNHDDETRALNTKERIMCEVCEKIKTGGVDCDHYVPSEDMLDPDVSLPDGNLLNGALMNVLGGVFPSDRQLWTSTDAVVVMSNETIAKILSKLNIGEDDKEYPRAVNILRQKKTSKIDTARRFCKLAEAKVKKNKRECTAKWQIFDAQNVRRSYSKVLALKGGAGVIGFCSCIVHDLNAGRFKTTPWEQRTTCASKMWVENGI